MSATVVHTSAPAHHHYTTLGLDSRKVAIWAFIGSECFFFASLISTYLIYRGRSPVGPFPHEAWKDPARRDYFFGHFTAPDAHFFWCFRRAFDLKLDVSQFGNCLAHFERVKARQSVRQALEFEKQVLADFAAAA